MNISSYLPSIKKIAIYLLITGIINIILNNYKYSIIEYFEKLSGIGSCSGCPICGVCMPSFYEGIMNLILGGLTILVLILLITLLAEITIYFTSKNKLNNES